MYSKSFSFTMAAWPFLCLLHLPMKILANAHSLMKIIISLLHLISTIITKEQIHDNHYKNLAEALSYANGVTVSLGPTEYFSYGSAYLMGDDRVAIC